MVSSIFKYQFGKMTMRIGGQLQPKWQR